MAEMSITCMVLGQVRTNVYIVWNTQTKKGWIVDPADDTDQIMDVLAGEEIKPEAILLTHGHFDHIGAVDGLRQALKIPVYMMEAEKTVAATPTMNASAYYGNGFGVEADRFLTDGQELSVAGFSIKAIHTPGHTIGGCCYYCGENGILFSGDTLFRRSVGRSDLPSGDGKILIDSIRTKLMELPDEVQVLPGHGAVSTIGYERANNPYL